MAIRFRIAKGALLGLAVMLAPACTAQNPSDSVRLSFRGQVSSFTESAASIYLTSYDSGNSSTYYLNAFDKNGKKNWEIKTQTDGRIYALRDGKFFYASKSGEVAFYNERGTLLWKTTLDLDEFSNSNFLLTASGALLVNLQSSPDPATVYCQISIEGTKTISPEIKGLTTCYTFNYPLGGYITVGYTGDQWAISRIRDDFSVEWTYSGETHEDNFSIQDISPNGSVLFSGNTTGSISTFLKELDPAGQVVKSAAYRNPQIVAAYFQDQIVATADKLRVLEADFTLKATYDFCLYPKIKILEDSFFVYSPGSYSRGASVTYDGYCKQYDKTNRLVFDKVFEASDQFFEIGENGKRYYRK